MRYGFRFAIALLVLAANTGVARATSISLTVAAGGEANLPNTDITASFNGNVPSQSLMVGPVSGDGAFSGGPLINSEFAFAAADLTTGTLRVLSSVTGQRGNASAFARLMDDLTFHLPTGVATANVGFTLDLHGSSSYTAGSACSSNDVALRLGTAITGISGSSYCVIQPNTPLTASLNVSVFDGETLTLSAEIAASTNTGIGTTNTGEAILDLSHTATIQFSSADGVTFASASGEFLIAPAAPAAVPEPASLLLLGSGLIGAGVRRYRRRP